MSQVRIGADNGTLVVEINGQAARFPPQQACDFAATVMRAACLVLAQASANEAAQFMAPDDLVRYRRHVQASEEQGKRGAS